MVPEELNQACKEYAEGENDDAADDIFCEGGIVAPDRLKKGQHCRGSASINQEQALDAFAKCVISLLGEILSLQPLMRFVSWHVLVPDVVLVVNSLQSSFGVPDSVADANHRRPAVVYPIRARVDLTHQVNHRIGIKRSCS